MKLLICEGDAEIAFLYAYLKEKGHGIKKENEDLYKLGSNDNVLTKNEIIDDVYIYSLKGRNLEKKFEILIKVEDEKVKELSDIGIFMDAEDNYKKTEEMIENIKNIMDKNSLNINVHSYISPYNNGQNGMIEDLVMDIVKNTDLIKYIKEDTFIKLNGFIENQGEKIKNPSKSQFLIYAATKNPIQGQLHFFLTKEETVEKLDFENKNMEEFKKFIRNFE